MNRRKNSMPMLCLIFSKNKNQNFSIRFIESNRFSTNLINTILSIDENKQFVDIFLLLYISFLSLASFLSPHVYKENRTVNVLTLRFFSLFLHSLNFVMHTSNAFYRLEHVSDLFRSLMLKLTNAFFSPFLLLPLRIQSR